MKVLGIKDRASIVQDIHMGLVCILPYGVEQGVRIDITYRGALINTVRVWVKGALLEVQEKTYSHEVEHEKSY